ncbi:MAG: peptidoglycan DD-metalloendopeptidase family protein, partial [Gemmatimonadetes bacterium]|nr:M23 family metallopeptidase [Gemmatimonadota bacterium]NIX45358.1 peptidoglycan DD-metalloendopeptidase family protein [Gemmatimonadota bacterium]
MSLLIPLLGLLAPAAAGVPLPLSVEVHARALAPGEPLRLEVRAEEPLAELAGSLLGEPVFLTRSVGRGAGERWSGWSMIPLDQTAGMATVEIQGRTARGRQVVGTRLFTVKAKTFPEEQLSVAPRYVEPPPEVAARLADERARLAEIYRTRRAWTPDETPFVRPVPGGPTSAFGTRRLYNGKPRSPHPGLDLRAASGTEVKSSGTGRVVLARDLYYSGNTVIVDHGGGLFTLYAHL